jgi:hypothetical protein
MSKKSKKEVEAIVSGMGVFTSIISGLAGIVKKHGGTMKDIYRLATPDGSETLEEIARIIVGGADKTKSEYLKLISGNEELILDAVDGSETLAGAKDIFVWVDPDLRNWNTDNKGPATGKTPVTPVQVYEIVKDVAYAQMFGSLSSDDLRKLCLTQHQIENFVRKYRNWLRTDGYATFFLFKSNNEFFVAHVYVDPDGLRVYVRRFEDSHVWHADYRRRLVVPATGLML